MMSGHPSPQTIPTVLPLTDIRPGATVQIQKIEDGPIATMALQFGLSCGQSIQVLSKSMGGPMVIQRANTEIALGKPLCRHIWVSLISSPT